MFLIGHSLNLYKITGNKIQRNVVVDVIAE